MLPIMISAEGVDAPVIEALVADEALQAKPIRRDRIIGGSELTTVLVTLTPVVLATIVKILKEKWARNSKVTIEARGVKIKGASPDDIKRILEQILAEADEDHA